MFKLELEPKYYVTQNVDNIMSIIIIVAPGSKTAL